MSHGDVLLATVAGLATLWILIIPVVVYALRVTELQIETRVDPAAGGVCGGAAFFGWFRYVVFRRAFADAANRSHLGRVA